MTAGAVASAAVTALEQIVAEHAGHRQDPRTS
jgi:hypothetical protein